MHDNHPSLAPASAATATHAPARPAAALPVEVQHETRSLRACRGGGERLGKLLLAPLQIAQKLDVASGVGAQLLATRQEHLPTPQIPKLPREERGRASTRRHTVRRIVAVHDRQTQHARQRPLRLAYHKLPKR
eukprot:3220913-Pleurochrysis_carterae.AAC.1